MNHLPISDYSGVKSDMKIFVNVARLEIGQLFTQGMRRGHLCTLDKFLVFVLDLCTVTVTRFMSVKHANVMIQSFWTVRPGQSV